MPKRATSSKSSDVSPALLNFLLAVSALLTLQFAYHICWIAQQYAVDSVENSPKTFSAIFVALVSLFVWVKSNRLFQRYVVVAMLTVIVMGYVVWLLGETGVGQYLQGAGGFWV